MSVATLFDARPRVGQHRGPNGSFTVGLPMGASSVADGLSTARKGGAARQGKCPVLCQHAAWSARVSRSASCPARVCSRVRVDDLRVAAIRGADQGQGDIIRGHRTPCPGHPPPGAPDREAPPVPSGNTTPCGRCSQVSSGFREQAQRQTSARGRWSRRGGCRSGCWLSTSDSSRPSGVRQTPSSWCAGARVQRPRLERWGALRPARASPYCHRALAGGRMAG